MARYGFAHWGSGVRWSSPDAHPTQMRNLAKFFENPFDDPSISMNELLAFVTDHLQRMIANNVGGELDARIAATSSALDLLLACATDDNSKLGLRKARNLVKDAFRKDLPGKVAKIGRRSAGSSARMRRR